uniref:Maturation protein n=1 Tax=Hubei levi-like virus 5 TaxID=1922917 RepID=A0A1L3KIN4_9VIRU|nr:hypothetical protein [Hubei levi-like virus 5]
MPISAHTSKPGYHFVEPKFTAEWKPTSGSPSYPVHYHRTEESYKSETVKPVWLRKGSSVFKRPTTYRRYVVKWSNPSFDGVYMKSDMTSIEATYREYVMTRAGNSPRLSDMPQCLSNNDTTPYWDDNAENRLIVECLNKLNEQKVAIGNALAEAKSTVQMIAGTASQLARAMISLKHGNWRGAMNAVGLQKSGLSVARFAANQTLQWKYGWSPLMGDIRDGVEALKSQLDEGLYIHAKRSTKQTPKWDFEVGSQFGSPYTKVSGSGTHRATVELWCSFEANYWKRAAHAYGLDDPLGILWEITPWSFVVDWLVPVGDLLSALTAREGLSLVGGYCSMTGEGNSVIKPPKWPDVRSRESPPNSVLQRFGFHRKAYTAVPFPLPYVKSPFSDAHTTSAIALLAQMAVNRLSK